MSERQVRAWVCDLCGHIWIAGKGGAPEKCAKCRKRGWNKNRPKDRPAQSRKQAKPLVQQTLHSPAVAANSPVDYKMRAAGEEEGEFLVALTAPREHDISPDPIPSSAGKGFDYKMRSPGWTDVATREGDFCSVSIAAGPAGFEQDRAAAAEMRRQGAELLAMLRAGPEFDAKEEADFLERHSIKPDVVEVKVDDVVVPLVAPADDGSKERFAAAVDRLAKPHPKIGEKCPHGWSSWFLCPKCNSKVNA